MSYDSMVFWGKAVIAAGTILSVLLVPLFTYIIYPYLIKPAIESFNKLRTIIDTAFNVHEIITRELQTNGGSSIKDALKRIENRLTIIDAKHKTILSLENEPIWESDEFGNCVWVNHSYLKMTGFDFEYLKNAGWVSIINEIDRSRVREEWKRAVEEKRIFSCEYTINRYDNTKVKHDHKLRQSSFPGKTPTPHIPPMLS